MADIQAFQPVKIRLLVDLPVRPEHSLFKGTIHFTIAAPRQSGVVHAGHWVQGSGIPIEVFNYECELVEDETGAAVSEVLDEAYWKSLEAVLPF